MLWPDADRSAYLTRLFGSHDFDVRVEVLNLDEKPIASATMLDGQVDIIAPDNGIRRTASITLLDDSHALDFGVSAAWSGTSLWVNRLLRVTHVLTVDGSEASTVCFVGVPKSIARNGAEVDVNLADKAALANRGSKPYTVRKGMDAVAAVRAIMTNCTGEFRFRFPATAGKRLSKNYSVGWDDKVSPFAVASAIARRELDMQLLYAADGALLMRKVPQSSSMRVPGVTAPPNASVDLSALINWAQVTGKATSKRTSKTQQIKTQPQAIAQLAAADPSSPSSLARRGVPRYLPLIVSDDSLTSLAAVKTRAVTELQRGGRAQVTQEYNTIPFFHADADDLVTLAVAGVDPVVRVSTGTIPLGVGGDMTIGRNVWSRTMPRVRSHVQLLKWRKITTKHKHSYRDKKGKKHTVTRSHTSDWKKV